MVNVDFLNISNAKLIGRLLPFWARGRRTSLLLQALLSPIVSAHESFKAWALERYIECHITSQSASLEWYLKHKLKEHFLDEDDEFSIADGIDRTVCCFSNNIWTDELPWDDEMRWDDEYEGGSEVDEEFLLRTDGILVYAPAIVDTISYDKEDYERDIRSIVSKYMVCFKKVNIIIRNPNKAS